MRAANGGALSIFIARCEDVGLFRRAVLDFTDDGIDVPPDVHRESQILACPGQPHVLQLHELDVVQGSEGRLAVDSPGILCNQIQKTRRLRLITRGVNEERLVGRVVVRQVQNPVRVHNRRGLSPSDGCFSSRHHDDGV